MFRSLSTLRRSVPALFEALTPEYAAVPLSQLDHPPPARSAQAALLALVATSQHADADALLDSFRHTREPILPSPVFAPYAVRRLREEAQPSSSWLRWWELVPSVSSAGQGSQTLARYQRVQQAADTNVTEVLDVLLARQADNFDTLLEFALLSLARDSLLPLAPLFPYFAAFAPAGFAEQLLASAFAHVGKRLPELEAQFRAHKRCRTAWRRLQLDRQRATAAMAFLGDRRDQIIRLYVRRGRFDEAARLVYPSTECAGPASTPSSLGHPPHSPAVNKFTLVTVLEALARANRFDLYEKVYAEMRASGRTLVRIARPTMTTRAMHFVRRAVDGEGSLEPPSVCREAFITSRYAHYQNPIAEIDEAKLPAQKTETALDDMFHTAIASSSFRAAVKALQACRAAQYTPPMPLAASFLMLARTAGHESFIETLLLGEHTQHWERAYWATAGMLDAVRFGGWEPAVRMHVATFGLHGLPEPIRLALRRVVPDAETTGTAAKSFFDPHTFSILVQALVPLLLEREGVASIEEVFLALVSYYAAPSASTRLYDTSSSPTPHNLPSSTHDAYSFIPILQALASTQQDPHELLDVLITIKSLSLKIGKEHWGVVLGAFAASSLVHPADTLYLLDFLDQTSSTRLASEAITTRLAQLDRPFGTPDRVAYTSMLAGLGKKGDFSMARQIRQRWEQGQRGLAGESDQRMEEVLALLEGWELGRSRIAPA